MFFSLVANRLNEYWDVRTQGLATDAELTTFEKASLAVGGAFLALWLLTLVLAIIVIVLAATG